MLRVLDGDRQALSLLVERHHSFILGYLYRLCYCDRNLAEDLTQETFIRILQRGHYQAGKLFKPWLYTIATNLAHDHFKSARVRHTANTTEEALYQINDHAPGPEELALAAEQGGEINSALSKLGEEFRVVLYLRFYVGLSLNEIAHALDLPLGTVKSRLSVGTRRLRGLLVENNVGLS